MRQSPGCRYLKTLLAAPYILMNAGIAPMAWLVISFLQQQYYTCAYFGPSLDSEVAADNASGKCHGAPDFRSRENEESYKTQSQLMGWSLMLMAVFGLFTSVRIRRCFRKRKELKMPSFEYYRFLEAETALKKFHTMAKECVKKNAKENAEKSFQNANNKPELDARIQMVANDVVQRYGMFFVIPSPESPAVRRVPEITRPDSQPLPLPLPHCGFHVIDGRPVPKSNGALSPSGLIQGLHLSEINPARCNGYNASQAVSNETFHRQNAVIQMV